MILENSDIVVLRGPGGSPWTGN